MPRLDIYRWDVELSFAAYNAGPGEVKGRISNIDEAKLFIHMIAQWITKQQTGIKQTMSIPKQPPLPFGGISSFRISSKRIQSNAGSSSIRPLYSSSLSSITEPLFSFYPMTNQRNTSVWFCQDPSLKREEGGDNWIMQRLYKLRSNHSLYSCHTM